MKTENLSDFSRRMHDLADDPENAPGRVAAEIRSGLRQYAIPSLGATPTAAETKQVVEGLADRHELVELAGELEKREYDSQLQAAANRARVGGGVASERAVDAKGAATWARKALMISSNPGGGYLDSAEVGQLWQLVTPMTAYLESGVPSIRIGADAIEIPVESTRPAITWVGEVGPEVAAEPTFGRVRLSLATATAKVPFSASLLDDVPELGQLLQRQVSVALGAAIDQVAFEGSTASGAQPTGLKNWTGIQTFALGADGAVPTSVDFIADAIGMLLAKNIGAEPVLVMAPGLWRLLSKIKQLSSGSNMPLLMQSSGSVAQAIERRIYGVRVLLTNSLSATEVSGSSGAVCQSVYVFDPAQLLFAQHRNSPVFLRDPYSSASSLQEILHVRARIGVGVMNPDAVVRVSGIKLA